METKISVKEYADRHNTSPQAVYKRINKGTLKTVKERINGKEVFFILLDEEAQTEDLNPITTNSTDLQPQEVELNPKEAEEINPNATAIQPQEVEKVENVFNPNSTPKTEGAEQSIIAFLQEQLKEKDRQIARLQEQTELQAQENKRKDEVIQEQLAKMNELLRNAQSLQAQSNVLLLEHNKPQEETAEEQEQEEAPPFVVVEQQEQEKEPKKQRSWLYRFFFGEE